MLRAEMDKPDIADFAVGILYKVVDPAPGKRTGFVG